MEIPQDITPEEVHLVEFVKRNMLRKLPSDRCRFIFTYVIMLGNNQQEAAEVMGVHKTQITRSMKQIRKALQGFR